MRLIKPIRWAKVKDMSTTVASTALVVGKYYIIASSGTTNWLTVGSPSIQVGTPFQATGTAAGTGTAYNAVLNNVDTYPVKNLRTYR